MPLIVITGVCGFVGSVIAHGLLASIEGLEIVGIDNLSRAGSALNLQILKRAGIRVIHGDIRQASDLVTLPKADWVIDAAANPSVLAGVDGKASSRQLVEHNLSGTLNVLEYCRQHTAGLILLSTSRVYSIPPLAGMPVIVRDDGFTLAAPDTLPVGISPQGITEYFSTAAPVSLYGATKLASEVMALEYGQTFQFPVRINRCGVLAGAGQFGKADQGIFSFWIHSWARRRPLKYIGFGGHGYQVRDCLHPRDLVPLLCAQMSAGSNSQKPAILNLSGGTANALSLRQLSLRCHDRFGPHQVGSDPLPRAFDLPWVVLDSAQAEAAWRWTPTRKIDEILDEIFAHTGAHPDWLDIIDS